MGTKFLESIKLLFALFDEIQRLREGQKQLNDRLEAEKLLRAQDTQAIRDLAHEVLHLRDHDGHERGKLMLRLVKRTAQVRAAFAAEIAMRKTCSQEQVLSFAFLD